jgi:nucleoside-diphosphate-sugar epimerase
MRSVLITGAGGFLGRYLCLALSNENEVIGVDLEDVQPVPGIVWKQISTGDYLSTLVKQISPDLVVHAAFINRKPAKWSIKRYIDATLDVNLPLFETMADATRRLILISSSAVYGKADGYNVIDEMTPLRPISSYGLAKLFQEEAAQYFSNFGLEVSIVRLFNLSGPGQQKGMLFPDLVYQACATLSAGIAQLRMKHRKTSRDWVDVRDAARAIALIASDFRPTEVFNVASGKIVSLEQLTQEIEKLCRPVKLEIIETDAKLANTDALTQCGSYGKIAAAYGWQPEISWKNSLGDLWNEVNLLNSNTSI